MNKRAFSVQEEIRRLAPVDVDAPGDAPGDLPEHISVLAVWDQLLEILRKIGRQQFRTSQNVELLGDRNSEALSRLNEATTLLRDQAESQRNAALRSLDEPREMALRVVEIIDILDDLLLLAGEGGDTRWIYNLERLRDKVLRVLDGVGITPIAAAGEVFDPEVHEALETVEREQGQRDYEVVSVLQRGFRFRGSVLRPVQVITTRP